LEFQNLFFFNKENLTPCNFESRAFVIRILAINMMQHIELQSRVFLAIIPFWLPSFLKIWLSKLWI